MYILIEHEAWNVSPSYNSILGFIDSRVDLLKQIRSISQIDSVITVSYSTKMITKIKWSRHRSFLYDCDRSPGVHVLKLGTEISNLKQPNWSTELIWKS